MPIEACIMTVADIFDALMHRRPYKRQWTYDEAVAELRKMVDAGQLDPDCVEAVVGAREEIESVLTQYTG